MYLVTCSSKLGKAKQINEVYYYNMTNCTHCCTYYVFFIIITTNNLALRSNLDLISIDNVKYSLHIYFFTKKTRQITQTTMKFSNL